MKRVGLLGGSFNPVHAGHVMLAGYLAQYVGLDEVWMVLSPLNPFKRDDAGMLPDRTRYEMLVIALRGARCVRPCDAELSMPVPSYTIDTLDALSSRHPECRFVWITGSDNWLTFGGWKDAGRIIADYGLIVYPRPGYPVEQATFPEGVTFVDAPTVDISSTFVRDGISRGLDMNFFLPSGVYDYILKHNLYK